MGVRESRPEAGPREAGAGDLVTQSAATSTPGEAVIRIEGIPRVNVARLITRSPGQMEV